MDRPVVEPGEARGLPVSCTGDEVTFDGESLSWLVSKLVSQSAGWLVGWLVGLLIRGLPVSCIAQPFRVSSSGFRVSS